MLELTQKQSAILEWIISETIRRQEILSVREIANNFKITSKGAYDHIGSLKKKGHVRIDVSGFGVYPVEVKIVRSTNA